ncbi:radical SAM protein [Streptosporangium sp. NPDC048865]|uniref:radical SAM/SPASM domain-containing protein n=1 Tax=Streptosporangium sp. NPDC048865 TaxID=3155766 RepID=UPI003417AB3D
MTAPQHEPTPVPTPLAAVTFLELEITNRCPLKCEHCYAESGPAGEHGAMTLADWEALITAAPAAGVRRVQFIGGEPTSRPGFPRLLSHAVNAGLRVEVFSNLFTVADDVWSLLATPGVTLATSYYSDDPGQHDRVTGRQGSHTRTRANIAEAIQRGIPIRAGIIDLGDGQRVIEARADLEALGVTQIRVDRVRGVGRGTTPARTAPNVGELCGRCGDGRAAVSGDGEVRMCVLSRFLPSAGNVRVMPLADILAGRAWWDLLAQVPRRGAVTACNPDSDGNDCSPAETLVPPLALVPVVLNRRRAGEACSPDEDNNDYMPNQDSSAPVPVGGHAAGEAAD